MSRSEGTGAREEAPSASEPDPAVEALRVDLISYLARRFDMPRELVLARLGDWLLAPISEERRKEYARANYLRSKR